MFQQSLGSPYFPAQVRDGPAFGLEEKTGDIKPPISPSLIPMCIKHCSATPPFVVVHISRYDNTEKKANTNHSDDSAWESNQSSDGDTGDIVKEYNGGL